MFLQEDQKDKQSEKVEQPAVRSSSISATAVTLGTNKKNVQLNKKALEKKDKQYPLEEALQQVSCIFAYIW